MNDDDPSRDRPILDQLRDLGVDYAQGVGIDAPKPLHQLLQLPEGEWNAIRARAKEALN